MYSCIWLLVMIILDTSTDYVQECIQWRKWRKIASLWPFELEAKSGPLETGDFGEIHHFRQNRQFPKGPFAISFEFLSTVWRFWGLIAISAIFANACISGHKSGQTVLFFRGEVGVKWACSFWDSLASIIFLTVLLGLFSLHSRSITFGKFVVGGHNKFIKPLNT